MNAVVVIGGGLAGMAAALRLAAAGRRVILCEQRPFLGGRAFSFRDPDAGATVDNGQHVLVGACARLRAFLAAIDAPPGAFIRQRRLALPILDGTGRCATLGAAPLPAPAHLAAALLSYRHLGLRGRLAVARGARALAATRGAAREALDGIPLGAWLARRGMPAAAIARFWEPLIRPALNAPVESANTPLAAFLLEQGLWRSPAAGALWLPAMGLTETLGAPGARALAAAGIDVRLSTRVRSIRPATPGDVAAGPAVELGDGTTLPAAAVIAAVPPRALDRLLPPSLGPPAGYGRIGSSAIINVYLWYDRPVTGLAFAGTFDSPLQWIFNRTQLLGADAAGGAACLGISLSAADAWLDRDKAELADFCDAALGRLFPARAAARRTAWAVVKEPHATFRTGPGLIGLRPGPIGPVRGLYLAGDWTDTGWPATMEGAVVSGETAAGAALRGG
ncbi:MAG: hydroxysqualene dehydroxylase HpnE [Gemmatimonadota bacterium]